MKTNLVVALVSFGSVFCAEPIVIPKTASPAGTFTVRLTHDRVTETDPPNDSTPDVEIIATATQKVLATFPFPADPNSDLQPLRTKVRANWNSSGTAVALSFSERFYTHLVVYRLQGTLAAPELFAPVSLPDTAAVIQAMIPRFKEFRSRWHHHVQGWPGRNTIQFSAGTGALVEPLAEGGDITFSGVYSFTVDISEPKTPVIKRIERLNEDDY